MLAEQANNNNEILFFSGNEYFAALIRDIDASQESVDLEAYIFSFDSLGRRVIDALERAVFRGVKVRVLVDGAGSSEWGGSLVTRLEKDGAQTRIFHPFPWRLWQWSRSKVGLPSLAKAIYLLLKINSRNHRKTCIIDGKIFYVGSFNISQNHLAKDKRGQGWRDSGVRLENIDLKDIEEAFESAWSSRPIQERIRQFFRHIRTNPIIRLNNSWHRRRILYKNLLNRIRDCNERIWITNAYFVPDNFLLRRLIDAARRGVDVRILLPGESDVAFMPWASKAFYEKLLISGVRIFEYLPAMLHAKTLILDDWMIIGSSNLNHRSLLHDLEVDVNLRFNSSKKSLAEQFLLDLNYSREIKLKDWQRRSWHQKIVGNLILYLKYLI